MPSCFNTGCSGPYHLSASCHPPMLSRVQIYRGDTPVVWLPERHALHCLNRSHLSEVVDTGYRRLQQLGRVWKRDGRNVIGSGLGVERSGSVQLHRAVDAAWFAPAFATGGGGRTTVIVACADEDSPVAITVAINCTT